MKKNSFFLLLMLPVLNGCASIIHGGSQDVYVSSEPPAAHIWIEGNNYGQTPKILNLLRKNEHVIELTLEGYSPFVIKLKRTIDNWVWGNLLLGGIEGVIEDATSGSMYKLIPDHIEAQLSRDIITEVPENGNLKIMPTMNP